MEIFFCEIDKDNVLNEEQCSKHDTLAKKVLTFRRQEYVVKATADSPCFPSMSRSYVEQVSNVAWPKNRFFRQRSHSYPMVKRLNPLPCLIEEDENLELEKPVIINTRVPEVKKLNWTDNKLSDEWLNKINRLTSTMNHLEICTPKSPHRSGKLPTLNSSSDRKRAGFVPCRQDSSKIRGIAPSERFVKVVRKESLPQLSDVRKPDSTYISLISGLTQETQKQTHAQFGGHHIDGEGKNHELKKAKNCKNLNCIQMNMFTQRKLFCSSPNAHRQLSSSCEYIKQIGR